MRCNNAFTCFSLTGLIISILYFSTVGLISEFVAIEYCPQLSDEFDLSPKFETNEKLFTIDNAKLLQTETIIYDKFVVKYSNYPETLISPIIMRNNLIYKSSTNQHIRYIPDTVQQYNNTALDLCRTNKTTIQPQAAEKDGRWLVVINQEDFVQSIPIEECMDLNNLQSNLDTNLLKKSDNLKCKQAFSKIYLFVPIMVNNNSTLQRYEFEYPSACEPYSN